MKVNVLYFNMLCAFFRANKEKRKYRKYLGT